ncbi:hypothetical protein ACFL5F_07275, partial [Planctomycetota bacterium]
SFQENTGTVETQIKAIIESAKEHDFDEPIVIKKTDVVAHSMGAILACLYIASGSYDDDVNRVISIGTPFSGSQFANYVLNLLMIMPPDDQLIWMGIIETGLEKFVQGSLFGGAVRDLQVGSVAINQFRNRLRSIDFPVPVYAITCDVDDKTPGIELRVVYWFFGYCDLKYNSGKYFGLRNVERTIFGTNNTDFVVSFDSQRGGSSKDVTENVIDHIHEADDDDVISQVKELLKSRISNFNNEGFKPKILDCSVPPVEPFPVIENSINKNITIMQDILQEEGSTDFITLVLVPNRAVYEPGENIHITTECQGVAEAVLFVTPFGWCEDKMAPYEYDFTIDQDFIGEFTIATVALDNAGLIDYKSISLYSESLQNLMGITVGPLNKVVLHPGDDIYFYVNGLYQDGAVFDITYLSTTNFTSSNPSIVEVSSKGVLIAKSPGQAIVTVENSELKEEIEIVVEPAKTFLPTQLIDDFNDNLQDPKWDLHELDRDSCWLEETNQRLEFRSNPGEKSLATYVSGSWRLIGTRDFAFHVKTHYTSQTDKEGLLSVTLAPDIEDLGDTFVQFSIGCDLAGPCFHYRALDRGEELQSARVSRNIEDATLYVRYDAQGDQLHLSFSGSDKNDTWQTVPGLLRSFWECEQISVCIGGTASGAKLDSGETCFDDFVIEAEDIVHASDRNCDYTVDDSELSEYTSQWLAGNVTAKNLLDAQSFWLAGHYYWDPANQIFKEGKKP